MQFMEWSVNKPAYCPQSHVLFVTYFYYDRGRIHVQLKRQLLTYRTAVR